MPTPDLAPTLFEDWRRRRERLETAPALFGQAYLDIQKHVLDYLLKRYDGAPEALRPARFPMPKETYFNHRAMVVHYHLGKAQGGRVHDAHDAHDAEDRASRILKRIAAKDPQASAGPPAGGSALAGGTSLTGGLRFATSLHHRSFSWQISMEDRLARFGSLDATTQAASLKFCFGMLNHLQPLRTEYPAPSPRGGLAFSREEPLEFLARCRHPEALGYVHLAWRERLAAIGCDCFISDYEDVFRTPAYRKDSGDLLRAELSAPHPAVRLRAASLLPEFGALDDVGLLNDLLALPALDDEDPRERGEWLLALKALAGLKEYVPRRHGEREL